MNASITGNLASFLERTTQKVCNKDETGTPKLACSFNLSAYLPVLQLEGKQMVAVVQREIAFLQVSKWKNALIGTG